jgi:DNA (cytosine-5)-methyltransferase 1
MKINHLDLFSGIGGFHLGFEKAGFKIKSYFSEIDQHAIAVYKHQFPTSTYVGSVTNVRGADLPRIDLITFGSPCQDFSLAGKRLGMEGQRSSLVLEAIRLISECRPSVFVWENVKGTFSSNDGADFWAIIQAFTNIGGYRLEWQLLNTSWFLPQNRERIYLVGYSTTTSGRGVFPIGASNEQTTLNSINVVASCENDVQSRRVYDPDGIGRALTSGDYKSPMRVQVKQIGTKLDSNGGAQPYQQDRVYDADGIVPALNQGKSDLIIKANYASKALNETIGNSNLVEGEPQALDLYNRVARDESPTLKEPHHNDLRLFDGYRIRRLTPIECERLQGFPDDHTSFGNYDGEVKQVSNTHRYKQCGNAVTVNVVEAVAKKCIPLFKTNLK